MKSKNILLINDLPGYGKVALSAMLPILSKMGYSLYNLPTALVSNTLDYGKFEILDTTSYMENTITVWNELGFQFDCISTGFILSSKQVDIITNYIKSQNNPNLLVVVDPIMGDDGKLYNGITQETVAHMKELSSYADILIPNYTEAAFIAGLFTDKPSLTKSEINALIDKLVSQGSKSVVITSIIEKDSNNHFVCGYDDKSKAYFYLPYDYIPVRFPGTGDIFSAVMVGELLKETSLELSVKKAIDIVARLIEKNKNSQDKFKGIFIEKDLDSIL